MRKIKQTQRLSCFLMETQAWSQYRPSLFSLVSYFPRKQKISLQNTEDIKT